MELASQELGSTANSYQVLAKLATGGMAEIFLARSAGLASVERYVVLKRVLRDRASDINWVRMFLDEARLVAQLQHPNVAQVYDVGRLGDSYFFTMEYVHGETVRSLIGRAARQGRQTPVGCVLAIAAGTAAGLHHAHTRSGMDGRPLGIVHRDVSPSNLMVGYDGSVKVVDFGVAKAADRVHETQSGAVKGKIAYLSPEQARGMPVDPRSDLFSLGIVVWEMLTGTRLYKHDSDFETMRAIITDPPPAPSSRRPDIPRELDALVLKLLAKNPDDRFQSAEQVGEGIEAIAMQTNSPLSPAGVSRWMRELFGNRREPWVELQHAQGSDSVTVTSGPIPHELHIPPSDPIDRRLASVIDLSAVTGSDAPERPTTQRPVAQAVTASAAAAATGASIAPAPSARWLRSPLAIVAAAAGLGILAAVVVVMIPSDRELVAIDAGVAATPDPAIVVSEHDAAVPVDAPIAAVPVPDDEIDEPVAAPPVVKATTSPPRIRRKPTNPDVALAASCATGEWAACTLAACRLDEPGKARRWFAKVASAQRPKLVKQCSAAGISLPAPRVEPDCDADPFSCP